MPAVTYPSPSVALSSFLKAAEEGNEHVAQACSVPQSWDRRGESALKAYAHVREGFRLSPVADPVVQADRAVIQVAIRHPSEPGRQVGRYALLERFEGSWGVAAVVGPEVHAAMFLSEQLPAIFEIEDLPADPKVSAWLARTAANMREQALLSTAELQEISEAPVLGLLPLWPESGARAFDQLAEDHEVVLGYGDLARRLIEADLGGAVALSSCTAFEGAPQVVGHLGQILAGLGQRTLLIDLDFERPSLHLIFGSFASSPGVSDALIDGADLGGQLREVRAGLDLLAAGRREEPPAEGFQAFAAWLAEARSDYDQILALAPRAGLGALANGLGFAPVLVAHAGAVPASEVDAARRQLLAEGSRLAGVIATRLDPSSVPDPELDSEVLRTIAEGEHQRVAVLGSMGLAALGRALGGLGLEADSASPVEAWTVFDTSGEGLVPLKSETMPSLELLLHGVEARLPSGASKSDPEPDKGPMSTEINKMIGAVLMGLGQSISDFNLDDLSKIPETAASTVADALDKAGQHAEATKVRERAAEAIKKGREEGRRDAQKIKDIVMEGVGKGAAQDRASGSEGASDSSKRDPLKRNLDDAVKRFAEEHGDGRPAQEILRDPEFMKSHGGEIAKEILGAIVQTIAPEEPAEAAVNPKEGGEEEPSRHAKVKVDLGSMLQNLLKAAERKSPPKD